MLANGSIIYALCFVVSGLGLFIVITSGSYLKKLFGLGIFQTSALLFFIALGYISDGKPPIINQLNLAQNYVNPLPQVLMLTAIVVAIANLAVGLSLVISLYKKFGHASEGMHHA